MKAAVFREVGKPLEIEDVDISKPGPREVLVRTVAAGVCHSDLHFVEGLYPAKLPIVLGHESAGIVEEVGEQVSYVKKGDHVITCLSAFCGECEYCLTGHMSLCLEPEIQRAPDEPPRLRANGKGIAQFLNLSSFAEYTPVHEHAIAQIRKDLPLDRAALIGCGVTTAAGAACHTADVQPGRTASVTVSGAVGVSAIHVAAPARAARIIAIDRIPNKLELAKEFGATDVIDAGQYNPIAAVRELTGGGVHYSFEAIGLAKAAQQAFKMVRRGGTATIIGMIPVGQMVEIHGPELLGEKRLQGCKMGSNRFRVDMPRFIEFYLQGKLHLDKLISRRIKLDQVNDAMQQLKTGEIARNVIVFE